MRGDSAEASQHKHGIETRPEAPKPLTILERVIELEKRVAALEAAGVAAIYDTPREVKEIVPEKE
jgi:hypothetical protein